MAFRRYWQLESYISFKDDTDVARDPSGYNILIYFCEKQKIVWGFPKGSNYFLMSLFLHRSFRRVTLHSQSSLPPPRKKYRQVRRRYSKY